MKKFLGLFLIVAFAALPTMANLHKFYVSITEIHFNRVENNFEISTKLFFDDLDNAMRIEEGKSIDDPIEDYAEDVQDFLDKHFYVEVDDKKVALEFVGIETEIDAVWVHYQSETLPEQFTTIGVHNDVFVDIFDTQQNIINFFPIKGKAKGVKGLYLNSSTPKDIIKLKK